MNEYCSTKGLLPEVIAIEGLDGVIGKRCASATVEFRCVTAAATYEPSGQRPDRDMNRNPDLPADRGQFGRQPDAPVVIEQNVKVQESGDIYEELKKLKELLDAHIITQEEFDARKAKILAR